MNSTALTNAIDNEISLDSDLLRDLADIEVVLVGGGEIVTVGN
jgi:hypothetical protein